MQLEFNGLAWLIGMAILAVLLFVMRRRGIFYFFFFSVFWVYLLVLVSVTVFPIPLGMDGGFRSGTIWSQIVSIFKFSGLNLIPCILTTVGIFLGPAPPTFTKTFS